ncbi:MAG: hypothetical protein ACJ8NS_08690 [Chthoniobacterales bacterium]
MAKPSHSTTIVGLLLIVGAACAVVSAATTSTNPDRPPVAKFETGLVRIWNEKVGPPVERDHTPEAKLGDAIIVELKNLDQWFAENLEAGAWAEEEPVAKADPAVLGMIKDHQLVAAAKVGEQLEILAALISYVNAFGNENAPEPSTDVTRLRDDPDALAQLVYVQWGEFKDDKGNAIDGSKLTLSDIPGIVDRCSKALDFIHAFTAQKTAKFLLTVNDIPLPGLLVETPKPEAAWRRDDDTSGLEIPPSYTWFEFRLRGGGSSTGEVHHERAEFAKAWTHLMESAGKTYSKPSTVALSLPGEKNSLPTNVTPTAEDPRCRFNLLVVRPTTPTPGQTHFKIGDAVYPLDERDLDNHVLKATIVEEPDAKSDKYLVHFDEKGGTDRYAATELARLPPDLIPAGVVRVWNGNQHDAAWEDAQKYEIPSAKMGDTLVVELRNFDVWLARQIDNGLFQDDPLLHQATQASKNLDAFIKEKHFANTVRVGRRIHRLLDDSPHMKGRAIVESLHQEAKHEDYLAALDFPKFSDESVSKISPPEKQPAPATTPAPAPPPQVPAPQSAVRAPSQSPDAIKNEQQQQRKAKADAEDAKEAQEQKVADEFLAPYKAAYSVLNELVASKLRTLTLAINDIPLGITPDNADYEPVSVSRRPGGDPKGDVYYWLPFSLRPKSTAATQEEKQAGDDPFKRLMAHPKFTMPSKVALALKSGTETVILPTAVTQDARDPRAQFNLIGIEKFKFYPMVLVFVLILGSLAFFAASTDILRDPCRRRPEGVEPVSLARTQMAFWFVVIAAAFAFLWVTTGNIDTINGTCLTLLAIGTTTALTSLAIQGQRSDRKDLATVLQKTPHEMLAMRPTELKEAMDQRKQELETVGATTMTPDEIAQEKAILKRYETEIACREKKRPKWLPRRVYFWRYRLRTVFEDLLTEEAGTYDFHRFQMLAWTLVLGAVFVAKVFSESTMPQFDSNLLLLMGISSGAYIGFKMAGPRKTDGDPPKNEDDSAAAKPA